MDRSEPRFNRFGSLVAIPRYDARRTVTFEGLYRFIPFLGRVCETKIHNEFVGRSSRPTGLRKMDFQICFHKHVTLFCALGFRVSTSMRALTLVRIWLLKWYLSLMRSFHSAFSSDYSQIRCRLNFVALKTRIALQEPPSTPVHYSHHLLEFILTHPLCPEVLQTPSFLLQMCFDVRTFLLVFIIEILSSSPKLWLGIFRAYI